MKTAPVPFVLRCSCEDPKVKRALDKLVGEINQATVSLEGADSVVEFLKVATSRLTARALPAGSPFALARANRDRSKSSRASSTAANSGAGSAGVDAQEPEAASVSGLDVDEALRLADAAQAELEQVSDGEREFIAEQEERAQEREAALKERLRSEAREEVREEMEYLRAEAKRLEQEVTRLERVLSCNWSIRHAKGTDRHADEALDIVEAEPQAAASSTAPQPAAAVVHAAPIPRQLPRSTLRSGAGKLALNPQRWC